MTLNVKVEELDLQTEQRHRRRQRQQRAGQPAPSAPRVEPKTTGFGMALEAITPQIARELNLPAARTPAWSCRGSIRSDRRRAPDSARAT